MYVCVCAWMPVCLRRCVTALSSRIPEITYLTWSNYLNLFTNGKDKELFLPIIFFPQLAHIKGIFEDIA